MAPTSHTRGWWRALFVDHPGIASKSPDASAGGKHKVWCRKCFDARVLSEMGRDEAEVRAGIRFSVRDRQTIENTRAYYITTSDVFHLQICFLDLQYGQWARGTPIEVGKPPLRKHL